MKSLWKALILGSGFEKALKPLEVVEVDTPFDYKVSVYKVSLGSIEAAMILRHGSRHENPPHMVKYRANIWALKKLGVERVIAVNTVGAINPIMKPGDLVVPHNLVDFTRRGAHTFYNTQPVVHIDFTDPYCEELRTILIKSAHNVGETVWNKSVYVCTEGPRFETAAEIRMFRILGADVVGMTGCPEASLAREMGLCYASLCLTSNMSAGMQSRITSREVSETASRKRDVVLKVLEETIRNIPRSRSCLCSVRAGAEFKM